MSSASHTAFPGADDTRQQPAKKPAPRFLGFDVTLDWLLRPLFGFGLAGIAVVATWYGGLWFALLIAIGSSAAVREWHRMLAGEGYGALMIVSVVGIVSATASAALIAHSPNPALEGVPWFALAAAAMVDSVLASTRRAKTLWHASALLYIGVPALSLVMIREIAPHGAWALFALFFAVWGSDTGALFSGSLIKGPKLWPALSPNKTWAGFFGGTAAGAVMATVVFAVVHANPWVGAALGTVAALVGHAGDLFESWVKRSVGRKNSGSLIPGHGGVLDRVDSMLFVAPVAAVVLLGLHFDPFVIGAP